MTSYSIVDFVPIFYVGFVVYKTAWTTLYTAISHDAPVLFWLKGRGTLPCMKIAVVSRFIVHVCFKAVLENMVDYFHT
jgi:hypothetical protein